MTFKGIQGNWELKPADTIYFKYTALKKASGIVESVEGSSVIVKCGNALIKVRTSAIKGATQAIKNTTIYKDANSLIIGK